MLLTSSETTRACQEPDIIIHPKVDSNNHLIHFCCCHGLGNVCLQYMALIPFGITKVWITTSRSGGTSIFWHLLLVFEIGLSALILQEALGLGGFHEELSQLAKRKQSTVYQLLFGVPRDFESTNFRFFKLCLISKILNHSCVENAPDLGGCIS